MKTETVEHNCQWHIDQNRKREKYRRLVRRLKLAYFTYEGTDKEPQYNRVLRHAMKLSKGAIPKSKRKRT